MTSSGMARVSIPAQAAGQRAVRDDVDEELLPIFLEEANELCPRIRATLSVWREQSGTDPRLGNQLQRILHTFKGSARMAGAMRVGELAHRIEGRIATAIAQSDFNAVLWDELERDLEQIGTAMGELAARGAAVEASSAGADELLQKIRQVNKLPFSCVSERLYRVARQTAKELCRRVNLELVGGEIELDSAVLEKMTAPLEHLLRNAIAHGIETPEQRERLGKPAIGNICLSVSREKNGAVIKFSDDGAGLDMARLRQKAVDRGLLSAEAALSEQQTAQLIFLPGLSTAAEVTEISGRGIGLDVVKSEVHALDGCLDVVSTQGNGLVFTICLPLAKSFPVLADTLDTEVSNAT